MSHLYRRLLKSYRHHLWDCKHVCTAWHLSCLCLIGHHPSSRLLVHLRQSDVCSNTWANFVLALNQATPSWGNGYLKWDEYVMYSMLFCEMMDASSIPHQMGFLTSDLSTWRALPHSISDSSSHPGTILHICFRSGYFLDLRKSQNRIFKRHPAFSKTFQPQHSNVFCVFRGLDFLRTLQIFHSVWYSPL